MIGSLYAGTDGNLCFILNKGHCGVIYYMFRENRAIVWSFVGGLQKKDSWSLLIL